jgi:hypothetical protein
VGGESVVNVVLRQRVGARREVVLAAAEVLVLAVQCLGRGGDEGLQIEGVNWALMPTRTTQATLGRPVRSTAGMASMIGVRCSTRRA